MVITILIALLILVLLILFRVNAFLAFLISSITVGLMSGMEVGVVVKSNENGLGDTLGSVPINPNNARFGHRIRKSYIFPYE